jgi:hypothetical protein
VGGPPAWGLGGVLTTLPRKTQKEKNIERRREYEVRMGLREIGLGGGGGLDSTGSGQGLVAGCCECGDEPSGSCATELVS